MRVILRLEEVLPGVFEVKEACNLAGREALSKLWAETRQGERDGILVIMQENTEIVGVFSERGKPTCSSNSLLSLWSSRMLSLELGAKIW